MDATKYVLSFKNGHKMNLYVLDGEKFIKDLIQGMKDKPECKEQFFVIPGVMLNLTDLTALHPDNLTA